MRVMRIAAAVAAGTALMAPMCHGAQARPQRKPNLSINVYRRSFTLDEPVALSVSTFNVSTVRFTARRFDLGPVVARAGARWDVGNLVRDVPTAGLAAQATWTYSAKRSYPDMWGSGSTKAPMLTPGAYVIEASSGGVSKRTWIVCTNYALTTKRSRDELLLLASDARTGRPAPGVRCTITAPDGKAREVATGPGGLWRGKFANGGTSRIYGAVGGHPLFLLNDAPPAPEPYNVYTFTDRPVYRPGHVVKFKAIAREQSIFDGPRGLEYRPLSGRKLTLEVRDPNDALVQRSGATTNANGAVTGELRLAPEPALGDWQIVVIIGESRSYGSFAVQAYRKPEYSAQIAFDRPHYVGGTTIPATITARYYFGQAVVGASVRYTIRFSADEDGETEPAYEGHGATDATGKVRLDIRTKRLPVNRTLSVDATVVDLSRRQQTASGSTLVTAGRFKLLLEPDRMIYRPTEKATIAVKAEDYDGKPVAVPVVVRLIETMLDEKSRPYKRTEKRQAVTDAQGKARAAFAPPRPGYLTVEAEAFDPDDNRIVETAYLWVAGPECGGYEYPTLDLVADRAAYQPGEVATILLNTSLIAPEGPPAKDAPKRRLHREAWALLTVEGEHLYRAEVVRLTSRSTVIRVPVSARHFPTVRVSATIVQDRRIVNGSVELNVPMDDKKLSVTVAPDRERYAPGEKATYTVRVRDFRGRPVATELTLGVVDDAVYAVRPDTTAAPFEHYYGAQDDRVNTDFSFAAQYSGGAFQTMPKKAEGRDGKEPAGDGIRVRRNFADTAYWNAFVSTGADGEARVDVDLPDNLTTWRTTSRAVSSATQVGVGRNDIVSSMPLLVRLELPRFWVNGDRATVSAVVHNYTSEARSVSVLVTASGLALPADANRGIRLEPGGQRRIDWEATVDAPGGSGTATVRVTADGGPGGQDATESSIPILAAGLKMVEARAGALAGSDETVEVPVGDLPSGATVTLSLSPSVASALYDALDYLITFPYGCAEQTTSAFLPAIAATRALKQAGATRMPHPKLSEWVNISLQKLYRYQHSDGGWNWWEFDETDGDNTAYVLTGLLAARSAGMLVDDRRIARGAECLLRLLGQERELSRRADWVLALAGIRGDKVGAAAAALYDKRDKLDTYARASLAMALHRLGAEYGTRAATLCREIAASAHVAGSSAHWRAEDGGYSWRSDDVTVTARALAALLEVQPKSDRILPAVRWLMANRRGKAWDTSKASAEAALALCAYIEKTGEMRPEYTASAEVDGAPVAQLVGDARTAFAAPVSVTLTPDQLTGKRTLRIARRGPGALYWTLTIRRTLPAEQAVSVAKGIPVKRTYEVTAEDPSLAGTVASGAEIVVTTELIADANLRYILLEDPVPAGCEVAPVSEPSGRYAVAYQDADGGSRQAYARQEVRDDRVVFFLNDLPKGRTHLTYRLYAETPGSYRVLPAIASLMYFPEVRGNSAMVKVNVGERP